MRYREMSDSHSFLPVSGSAISASTLLSVPTAAASIHLARDLMPAPAVSVGVAAFADRARVLAPVLNEGRVGDVETNQSEVPRTLADLTSEDTFTSILSVQLAAKLGIPFGSSEGSVSRKIYIQEYAKFVELHDEVGGRVRWGIAIRWITNIRLLDGKADLSSLPMLSASVQLGYVEASCKFEVLGISSQAITNLVPSDTELTIETYFRLKDALEKIKSLIWDEMTIIKPQLLAIYAKVEERSEDVYKESLIVTLALYQIKSGRTIGEATTVSAKAFGNGFGEDTIKQVYADVAKLSEVGVRPSSSSQSKAEEILKGLSVKVKTGYF